MTREASISLSTVKYNSINTGPQNILWSSIQMWSTSKESKTGYAIKTGPTEKVMDPVDLRKRFSKIRETFASDPQLSII